MLRFEEYLADFTNTVNVLDFIINLVVATILSMIIKYYYIRFGKSFSNREKFSVIFVPMALTTLLIITVVQASIALSLGLVGALSIVRFRAAIKEPEELTYIFLVIGVGLTCGANKPLLAIVAVAVILPLVYLNGRFASKNLYSRDKMLINIRSRRLDVGILTNLMTDLFSSVELKRFEQDSEGIHACFLTRTDNVETLSRLTAQLRDRDKDASISILDQPEVVL